MGATGKGVTGPTLKGDRGKHQGTHLEMNDRDRLGHRMQGHRDRLTHVDTQGLRDRPIRTERHKNAWTLRDRHTGQTHIRIHGDSGTGT